MMETIEVHYEFGKKVLGNRFKTTKEAHDFIDLLTSLGIKVLYTSYLLELT